MKAMLEELLEHSKYTSSLLSSKIVESNKALKTKCFIHGGYISSKYFMEGIFSEKLDAFSF